MAVIASTTSQRVNIQLNNGTVDGKVRTLNVSLGSLDITGYDDQKAMNVANALEPCFEKNVYRIQKTTVATLSNE